MAGIRYNKFIVLDEQNLRAVKGALAEVLNAEMHTYTLKNVRIQGKKFG